MKRRDPKGHSPHNQDKQLQGVTLEAVLEKRRLGQALNAKEFAVCVGVSYSTARHWIHLPGFPVFQGVVFWEDFVHWRMSQNLGISHNAALEEGDVSRFAPSQYPPRAEKILLDS